jgi:carbon-monoxide dehydrogenase iron sulfur subunit
VFSVWCLVQNTKHKAQSTKHKTQNTKHKTQMKKVIVANIERCMGCHSCELACAVAHSVAKDLTAMVRAGEKPGTRIYMEAYEGTAIPIHCNHCEEAACLLACPSGAIYREEERGPVMVDTSRCIGCRMCVQACPFGVITLDSKGKGVLKCDLCMERLAEGQEPACENACPTKVVVYQSEEDANRDKRRETAKRMVLAQMD